MTARDDGLTEYCHPSGLTLPLPLGWERVEDPRPDMPIVAAEPENDLGFRANIVVTVDELPGDLDLQSWQATTEVTLPRALHDYLLLDLEHAELRGRQVVRRLAHHLVKGSGAVTMEQWATTVGSMGYTLTASVASLAYDSLADMFAAIATEWEPPAASNERTTR